MELMECSVVADDNFISKYEEFLSKLKGYTNTHQFIYESSEYIIPNNMQKRAVEKP